MSMTREEAREAVREAYAYGDTEYANEVIKALEQEPTYKVGKWIKQTLGDGTKDCVMCSECKTHWELECKFCPNCGAKMVEPQESEG